MRNSQTISQAKAMVGRTASGFLKYVPVTVINSLNGKELGNLLRSMEKMARTYENTQHRARRTVSVSAPKMTEPSPSN